MLAEVCVVNLLRFGGGEELDLKLDLDLGTGVAGVSGVEIQGARRVGSRGGVGRAEAGAGGAGVGLGPEYLSMVCAI